MKTEILYSHRLTYLFWLAIESPPHPQMCDFYMHRVVASQPLDLGLQQTASSPEIITWQMQIFIGFSFLDPGLMGYELPLYESLLLSG